MSNSQDIPSNQWYRWYPGDFARDTRMLSLEEKGAYRELIDYYFSTRGAIPSDPHMIKRILGVSLQKTRRITAVLEQFFVKENKSYYHKKIEFELSNSLKRHKSAVANGKAGGKAKALANSYLPEPEPEPNKPLKKEYPKELNEKAWESYIDYRKKVKLKKLQPVSEEKQIEKLISFGGYEIQEQCINETISNGWQGIFPPKGESNGNERKGTNGSGKKSLAERVTENRIRAEQQIDEQSMGKDGSHIRS